VISAISRVPLCTCSAMERSPPNWDRGKTSMITWPLVFFFTYSDINTFDLVWGCGGGAGIPSLSRITADAGMLNDITTSNDKRMDNAFFILSPFLFVLRLPTGKPSGHHPEGSLGERVQTLLHRVSRQRAKLHHPRVPHEHSDG